MVLMQPDSPIVAAYNSAPRISCQIVSPSTADDLKSHRENVRVHREVDAGVVLIWQEGKSDHLAIWRFGELPKFPDPRCPRSQTQNNLTGLKITDEYRVSHAFRCVLKGYNRNVHWDYLTLSNVGTKLLKGFKPFFNVVVVRGLWKEKYCQILSFAPPRKHTYKDKVELKTILSTFLPAPIHLLTIMMRLLIYACATIPRVHCASQSDLEPTCSPLGNTAFWHIYAKGLRRVCRPQVLPLLTPVDDNVYADLLMCFSPSYRSGSDVKKLPFGHLSKILKDFPSSLQIFASCTMADTITDSALTPQPRVPHTHTLPTIIQLLKSLSLPNILQKNKNIEADNNARSAKTLNHTLDPAGHPELGSEVTSLITIDPKDLA
ncbi:uncharacterized protein LACBIDRAFT_325314 [Laccaria bicolor S238N-H82]|uniref:Predicted protein n=1 Tax=Laccaria bicolor (strain S238N-H82 / ATCC MYA-4686) TaxID=486041 RepID=B0D4I4_LACBS|nr:uncharacterized protein LACBIDRAFT_325314 [Laccaria bicolor S238N-H82]EDR10349.1 predicted protein [Laccaria bicolor S238N-H82]|eukprot:XP_001878799.1 predicted protein [Laccaria bicolor S238N-H82]